MIEAIKEINFPAYATLSQATVVLNDMGDRTITADVKIDGSVIPDFSYDWAVEFKGERYIQPLRKPHAIKDNKSLRSTISLTFYHWAIYQLKRDYFVELASTQAGTAFADKYIVPLTVNLGEFVVAFNNVLSYYFPDGDIYIDLNPEWAYNLERQYVDINNSYLWDILQKTHELFGVRWNIERDGDNKYAIRMGYPAGELTHVFEYGFEGGLLKIERQVQDANIRNKILGRGGSQNLPYLYFKDYDKYPLGGDGNQGMIPDPDAIPELANIYFSELRDSNFRSYVQGWKTNPNRQLVEGDTLDEFNSERAESDYAYMRGATDEKFDPVEYVKDDASIAEYGELVGRLENNEDIYPSLQGMEVEITSPDGHSFITRADEIVAVQEVNTDSIASDETEVKSDIKLEAKSQTSHGAGSNTFTASAQTITVSSDEIEVPEGYEGTLFDIPTVKYTLEWKERIKQYMQYKAYSEGDKVSANTYKQGDNAFPSISYKVIDVITNKEVTPVNVPEGRYRVDYTLNFPSVTLGSGIIHAQQTPSGLGQTERLKVYWLKRNITTSAAIICKSFNGDVILNKVDGVAISESVSVDANSRATVSITGDTFSVPAQGAIMVDVPISVTPAATTTYSEKTIKVVNAKTNEIVPAINIPEGEYKLLVDVALINESSSAKTLKVELLPANLYFVDNREKWEPTFDVWIKNIFNTKKSDYPSEEAYVEGVWSPLRTEDEMILTFSSGNLSGHDGWEFKVKKGGIAYDNSRVIVDANGNEVRSEWRLTLIKSDAELETIKKYIPYKDFNAKAGDTFFFTGIILPHQYILSAEKELTEYKSENLSQTKDIKPQWVVSLDKVRAHRQDAEKIIDQLYVGSVITLKDRRFIKNVGERQILQSITYEWQESSLLPNIDVVLSEKVSTSLSTVAMLQSKVESLAKQVGGISNLEQIVRKIGDLLYLRKDGFEDTSYSPTRFSDTVSSDNFRPGAVGGTGWAAYQDEKGLSVIEADKLFVRNEMLVNSIIVNQIAAFGGTKIMSAADMTISAVETVILDGDIVGDRCFFDTKGASKANLFAIDDIAYSNVFSPDNAELKYYKRRVIEVGSNYITLSTTESDGDGVPQVGDTIVHFGNFTNKDRQSFIIIDPLNGGKIEVYAGVNSFSISGCNMIGMGVNPDTNESFLYGYGDMFFGERGGSGHFISFDKSTGKFKIKAEVEFSAGSSGLENLEEWSEKQNQIDKAQADADTAKTNASNAQTIANTANASVQTLNARIDGFDDTIAEINNKLDGVVESFFEPYTPSKTNEPAKTWIEEGTEDEHIGDTFTNTSTSGEDAGKSWRWLKQSDETYDWQLIADSDASKALALAGQAMDSANRKTTTFLVTPSNYKKNDIWIVGDDVPSVFAFKKGDILVSNSDSALYVANHWSKVINYNDEFQKELDASVSALEKAIEDAETASQNYTDEAKTALQSSIDALNRAKADLEDVYDKSTVDGKVSASEQRAIDASKAYAEAQNKVLDAQIRGWADGEIKQAEQDAIDAANAELEEAKKELDAAIAEVEGLANTAIENANNAASKADAATTEASSAKEIAEAAKSVSESASALAQEAKDNASTAIDNASEAVSKADTAQGIASAAQNLANEAKELSQQANTNAEQAKTNADKAMEDAQTANDTLGAWAGDGISPIEKKGYEEEMVSVILDFTNIRDDAYKYGLTEDANYTEFVTAYETYYADLDEILRSEEEVVPAPEDFSIHLSMYYASRFNILQAISTKAKEVADDAQKAADDAQKTADDASDLAAEAKDFAEIAKQAADDANKLISAVDGDTVLTGLEKQSLRESISRITSITDSTKLLGPVKRQVGKYKISNVLGTVGSKVVKSGDTNNGYSQNAYVGWNALNGIGDSKTNATRMVFSLDKPADVTIEYQSNAETRYDFLVLGALDVALDLTKVGTYTSENSDITKPSSTAGNQDKVFSKTFPLTAGTHFIDVCYRKDGSQSTNTDAGYFRVISDEYGKVDGYVTRALGKGSFPTFYNKLADSEDEEQADRLHDCLVDLLDLLLDNDVWDEGNTTVFAEFRKELKDLVAEYCGYEAETVKNLASDWEYLKTAFSKGTTNVSGGVVMTNMVAVKDADEEEVEAFLNGSDFGYDEEHRKLILAAGIPEGTDALDERARNARTRLYENGFFKTIKAEFEQSKVLGSSRSPFVEGAVLIDGEIEDNHYNFDESAGYGIDLPSDIGQSGRVMTYVGTFYFFCTDSYIYDRGKVYGGSTPMYTGHLSDYKAHELVSLMAVTVSEDKVAWIVTNRRPWGKSDYCDVKHHGMVAGFRPKCVVLNDGETYNCTSYDHTLISNSAGTYTNVIVLPSNPQDGQEIKIWKNKDHLLKVKTSDGRQIWRMNISRLPEHGIDNLFVGTLDLVYHSSIGEWLMMIHETY